MTVQVFQRLLATVFSVRRRLTGCTQRRRSATHSTINALQVHIIIINVVVVVVDGIVVVVQVVLARYVEVRPARTIASHNKKLSYRRGTARCVVSVEISPVATQQCRNYLHDKSWTKYQLSLIDPCDKIVL